MASRADLDAVPKPITPGPQMRALARFHPDYTWTGTIEEGGMGPGTPAMTATGRGEHHHIQDGRYPPDTRIPTESELVETYEVARSTARRAVAALREEGLVYTVQARGTYVARLDGATR